MLRSIRQRKVVAIALSLRLPEEPTKLETKKPSRKRRLFISIILSMTTENELLDLRFLELDVLARNRVVLGLCHLFRHRAAVLLRYVEEAGVSGRQSLILIVVALAISNYLLCIFAGA